MQNPDVLITSAAFFSDPYSIYTQLRQEASIFWSERWRGWVLLGHDDIAATLRDPQRFSSAGRIAYLLQNLSSEMRAELKVLEEHYRYGIATAIHQRTLVCVRCRPFFAPRDLEPMRATVETLIDSLLAEVASTADFDLIATRAYPLPAIVVLNVGCATRRYRTLSPVGVGCQPALCQKGQGG